MQFAVVLLVLSLLSVGGLLIQTLGKLREARSSAASARERVEQLKARITDYDDLQIRLELISQLAEAAYDALILVNSDHQVLHLNKSARKLFHVSRSDLQKEAPTVIAITRHHEIEDAVYETLATNDKFGAQADIWGRPYRLRTAVYGEGSARYVTVVLEDVSELERLGRARRDFVANISHELRTPITAIRLLAETLERDQSRQNADTRLATKILAQAANLEQMAQELLDLAMIESGRAEFIFRPVTLLSIVEKVVEGFSEQFQRNHNVISVDVPAEVEVLVDPDQIQRVLSNLVHNALKYGGEGARVQIYTRQKKHNIHVLVADNGPGIPPDERERVFERFYRGDRSRQRGGTGLGLAIAKHIIAAHNGKIWAEDPPDPPGIQFGFSIPHERPAPDDGLDDLDSEAPLSASPSISASLAPEESTS